MKIKISLSAKALIIFVKNPEIGKVKTRLASSIGSKNALIIYERLLEITRKECLKADADRYLFFHEQIVPGQWAESKFSFCLQSNGDLGQKMKSAFAEVLKTHDKAVIIGSDCPEISGSIIEEAFVHLDSHDFVIGPSRDGGYYLLGLNKLDIDIFSDINWSTEQVLPLTIQRIDKAGRTVKLLTELNDIDLLEDLLEFPSLYNDLNLN